MVVGGACAIDTAPEMLFDNDSMQKKCARIVRSLLLLRGFGTLDLLGPTELFRSVLTLFPQFTRCFVDLGGKTRPDQSVLGLKLPLRRLIIVDQRETSAPPSTKLCSEAKCDDARFVCFVQTRQLLRKLRLGDIRS